MAKNNYHQFQQNYDQTYSRSEESELKVLVGIILILKMQNILLKNHNFFKGHILSSLRRKKLASQFSDRPPERYKTTSTCLPLPPPSLSAFLYIYTFAQRINSMVLRHASYWKNTSKINTCVVLIRIIITFANQIFQELV